MNLGGVFYTPQSFKLHNIDSSFANSYLLKHGNIFNNASIKAFPVNLKRADLDKEVKKEPVCNDVHSESHVGSPSPEKSTRPPEDIQNAPAAGGEKNDTWILGNQKLSWDNSTVASYNPETKMFRCVVCNAVGFLSRIAEHYLGTHTSAKVFQCLHCPYSSTWSRCVRMHMAKHHGVPNAPPSLWKGQPLLEEIFHLLNTLKTTVDGQGKEKADVAEKKFACPKCPYTTDRRDLFLRHENIHNEEKPYHCYVCYRLFNRADHVKKHFLRIHRDHQYDINLVRRNPSKLPPAHNNWSLHNNMNHSVNHQIVINNRHYSQEVTEKDTGFKEDVERTKCRSSNVECHGRALQSCYAPKFGSNFPCSTCDYIRAKAELLLANVYTFRQKLVCEKCKFIATNSVEFEDHLKNCCSGASTFCEKATKQSPENPHSHGEKSPQNKGKGHSANEDSGGNPKTNIKGSIQIIPLHNSMSLCYSPQNSEQDTHGFTSFKAHIPDVKPRDKSIDYTVHEFQGTTSLKPSSDYRNKDENADAKSSVLSVVDIVCWHCGCEFADESSLLIHKELYHRPQLSNSHFFSGNQNKKKRGFVCVVCEFCCATQMDMMEHMRCHTGVLLKCYAGKHCNFTTIYDSDLSQHISIEHKDGIIRCPHCGLPCLVTAAFIRHYKDFHHPYPCSVCRQIQKSVNSEKFPSNLDLKRQANPYNTHLAQSGFLQESLPIFVNKLPTEKNKRSRKQTTPRKVLNFKRVTSETGKKLADRSDSMNSHTLLNKYRKKLIRSQTARTFGCRTCCDRTVIYKEKKSFLLHNLWVHSRRKMKCSICEEKFQLLYQLVVHQRKQHVMNFR